MGWSTLWGDNPLDDKYGMSCNQYRELIPNWQVCKLCDKKNFQPAKLLKEFKFFLLMLMMVILVGTMITMIVKMLILKLKLVNNSMLSWANVTDSFVWSSLYCVGLLNKHNDSYAGNDGNDSDDRMKVILVFNCIRLVGFVLHNLFHSNSAQWF